MRYLHSFILLLAVTLSGCSDSAEEIEGRAFYDGEDSPEIEVPTAPRISGASSEPVRIPDGSSLHNLTCEYSGVPTPKVVWAKDGSELPGDLKVENHPELGRSILFFPQTNSLNETALTGTYICAAANFVSRTQKSYEVNFGGADEELTTTTTPPETATDVYDDLEKTTPLP